MKRFHYLLTLALMLSVACEPADTPEEQPEEPTLEFKITDRFGNVYTESMERPKEFSLNNYNR